MIVIYRREGDMGDVALGSGDGRQILVTATWEKVFSHVDEIDLLVAIVTDPTTDFVRQFAESPLDRIPSVLVSGPRKGEADDAFGLPLHMGHAEVRFRRPSQASLRLRARAKVTSVVSESEFLRNAMETAVTARPPLRTVRAWAQQMGVDRRTLWAHWNAFRSSDSDLSPHDFLSWIQLLEGLSCINSSVEEDWASTAEQLRVSRQTLRRKSRRFCGSTLEELADEPPEEILRRFEDRIGSAFDRETTEKLGRG